MQLVVGPAVASFTTPTYPDRPSSLENGAETTFEHVIPARFHCQQTKYEGL